MNNLNRREVLRREENDDHLSREERELFLRNEGVEFSEENLDDVFVDYIFNV
jgi:hypothetical protein